MAMMLSSLLAPALTAPIMAVTGSRVAVTKMALVDKMCAACL